MDSKIPIGVPSDVIKEFCRKWNIEELALFGSALRDDFGPDSDFDLLATFANDERWSLFDHARMREDLSTLLGRDADVLEEAGLRNPFRRREILATRKVIYAAS